MKNLLLYILFTVILTSCSSYISVVNKTDNPIEIIATLNKDEQADFNLTYSKISEKNLLKQNLEPNQVLKVKKRKGISLVAISEDSDFYLKNDIDGKNLNIDKSIYNSSDLVIVPDIDEPKIIELKIENQSRYIIEKISLKIEDSLRVFEIDNMMNFWNLIFPLKQAIIKYELDGFSASSKLVSVTVKGRLKEEKIEKTYNKNLNSLIIFKE